MRESIELLPKGRGGLLQVNAAQGDRKFWIIGGNEPVPLLSEGLARARQPIFRPQRRKLVMKQPPQDFRPFFESSRLGQFADIALNAHQALRLDYRPNVIENN